MLNHITLMGRLVANPELRTTPTGTLVSTFRIAVDRDFKNKQTGERETDFVTIVTWRSTAEFVSRYFAKGRMAVVDGRLQMRPYTDRDGNKRIAAEVVADSVYFGDSKRDGDDQGGAYGGYDSSYGRGQPSHSGGGQPSQQFEELEEDDGDLPF